MCSIGHNLLILSDEEGKLLVDFIGNMKSLLKIFMR